MSKWIAASVRKPLNAELKIVTILNLFGGTLCKFVSFGWYCAEADYWIVNNEKRRDVIAWRTLPPAYPAEENENEHINSL